MIIPPFVQSENYFFDQETGEFLTYSNQKFETGSKFITLESRDKDKKKKKIKVSYKDNCISCKLPNNELETIQKIFDATLSHLGMEKVRRYRGYVSLKKNGVMFNKEFAPEEEENL